MRRLMPLLLLLAVGACESVLWVRPLEEERSKRFEPPAPNVGVLYIYRHGRNYRDWQVAVSVVGTTRLELPPDTFVRVETMPGLTEVNCIAAGLPDRRQADLAGGQIRYFEVEIRPGTSPRPYCLVSEVDADYGQGMVRLKRQVEPL